MRKICYLFLILLSLGCSKKVNKSHLLGSWWYFENDSTYSESYINENEWVYNHIDYGPFSYKYYLFNDSICIGEKKWALDVTDTSLVLNNQSENFILHKLSLEESVFDSRRDNLDFDNFQEEFMRRALGKPKITK